MGLSRGLSCKYIMSLFVYQWDMYVCIEIYVNKWENLIEISFMRRALKVIINFFPVYCLQLFDSQLQFLRSYKAIISASKFDWGCSLIGQTLLLNTMNVKY